ncbi:hypothetical protein [Tengunoibacter tsumagoiensis]|uniref:Uncharacterized protein n=1 Tax=Tengunoibacter tsumagoiensis TaxID=2014871 RepID=A0A402A087_9CHLR|nr:hypothetical protein [Tengunoibacter tsumagoiensis]GCE12505.1 hypothetical protein KTT_23640 [Tengunoibacter tsumagoiensis]
MQEETTQSLLYYKSQTEWMPLPNWANFYIVLGKILASRGNARKRTVIGIALPTISYAASLITVGITANLTRQEDEISDRFQQLSRLAKDTQLFYRTGGKRVKVFWESVERDSEGNVIRIWLDTKIGGGRYSITKRQAFQVEFPLKDFSSQPKRPAHRVKNRQSPFLLNLLDAEAAEKIISQSSLDTLIIGTITHTQAELQEDLFAIQTLQGFVQGTLQDIARARILAKGTETYRSDIYHVNSKESNDPSHEIPSFVIFNGASSFLKCRDVWRQSHWVVLLDQTERDFDIAIQAFNDEYAMSPVEERDVPEFLINIQVPHIPIAIYQDERL